MYVTCTALISMYFHEEMYATLSYLKKIYKKDLYKREYINSQTIRKLFRLLARKVSRSKSFNEDQARRERCATLNKLLSAIRQKFDR